jgi:NAD(P)-dependent dehydrogenase (short-subunit alcohol dehydrogenase family)
MMLKNKNIFVTGVGKGIGLDLLNEIIKEGGFVYGVTRSKLDIKKIKLKNAKIYYGDVRNVKLIKKIFKDSLKDRRIITGIVNNAAERQRSSFEKINLFKLEKLFKINFFSIFSIMKIFYKYISNKNVKSSIVNLGSIVGKLGFEHLSGYASTKTALVGLTKSFAVEMADRNIRANIVNPGFIETSYFKNFKKKKKLYSWTLSRIPMKRWGESNEISKLICFLLSQNSSYINGQEINIDGGWTSY